MSISARGFGRILVVGVLVAVATSPVMAVAQSKAPSGSYRVDITSSGQPVFQLSSPWTFVPGGGLITSSIPLGCMPPGQTMTEGHGQWSFSPHG